VDEQNSKKRRFTSFEELDAWKACTNVRCFISKLVKKYPPEEKFRLVDDMLRSSRSATHNIAEGFGRFHFQENIQFCRHSRGSLHELVDQLITSLDDGFISEEDHSRGRILIGNAIGLLNGYINYLKRCKNKDS
jgi:four helix bundle protein